MRSVIGGGLTNNSNFNLLAYEIRPYFNGSLNISWKLMLK